MTHPLTGFRVERGEVGAVGTGLQRPECILAVPDGTLWTADGRGGVMEIRPGGVQRLVLPDSAGDAGADFEEDLRAGAGFAAERPGVHAGG